MNWIDAKESAPTDEAEVAALKARVAELERERDMALAERDERQKALEVTLEERTSAFSERNWAYERYDEARARVIELEQGNVRRQVALETRVAELERDVAAAVWRALASAPSAEPEDPDYSGLCSAPECGGHCGYVHARGCEAIREYLADHGGDPYKAPSRAEPTPRDMRVAEAVREAYARAIIVHGRLAAGAIDLAAVVAKAVGT